MTLEDLPAVMDIDRLSFPLPWPERSYRYELLENPASHMLVAAQPAAGGPRPVGFIGFWQIIDEAHISTLAVHPDHRREGLGADLLTAALDLATQLGSDMATLEVRVSNEAAVNLYHKFGFRIVGRRPRYYRDNDEDALLMTVRNLRRRRIQTEGGDR
jgi:[ribosomal protein S18]-alanine N-acetyltransferase